MTAKLEEIIPTARIKDAGYESIGVDCPLCGEDLTLSRASDLSTSKPISGMRISCEKCKRWFWLNGDHVCERHEFLIYDCHNLLATKRYMNCILNICQAYEMFFSLHLRVNLLYVPFGTNRHAVSLDELNQLSRKFSGAVGQLGFVKMRNAFLRLAVEPRPPNTLDETEKYINVLCETKLPKDSELKSIADENLANLLVQIKQMKINNLRNNVIHQTGYRPKRIEAEGALKEARSVLFPLTWQLNLRDDVNWYCKDYE